MAGSVSLGWALLLLAAVAITTSSALIAKKRADQPDGLEEFARKRRVPYLYPSMGGGFGRSSIDEEYDDEDDADMAGEFYRKRRGSPGLFHFPSSHKFQHWKQLVERRNDDGMERVRRIPYFYPRYNSQVDFDDDDEEDNFGLDQEKRVVKKRGIPYFYPNYHYQYLRQPEPFKRFVWKREDKRSLGETLSNDDVTAFGYDKRSDDEEDIDEGLEGDRRRKRMMKKKNSN